MLSRTGMFPSTLTFVRACVHVCCSARGGGRASVVIKRWNINATLPLISFHLSSSCPLYALSARLSHPMNRYTSDINRQLVCSVFQSESTKNVLGDFSFLLKISKSYFVPSCQSQSDSCSFDPHLTPRLRPCQIYQCTKTVVINCRSLVFVFIAIFNRLNFEHAESGYCDNK